MDVPEAALRVVLISVDKSAGEVMQDLQSFDVDRAHCYDPNEEAKLRRIINAVGKERFEARIRTLAAAVQTKDRTRWKPFKTSGTPGTWSLTASVASSQHTSTQSSQCSPRSPNPN